MRVAGTICGVATMSNTTDDVLSPWQRTPTAREPARIIAFVPITIALVGVAVILSAVSRSPTAAVADKQPSIDPVVTGSIGASDKPDDIGRTIEMLDR